MALNSYIYVAIAEQGSKYPCWMAKYSHIVPFGLRLQPELKEKLEKSAQIKKNSLNAEIVGRLEKSVELREELSGFSDGELIDELIRRWGRDNVVIKLGSE